MQRLQAISIVISLFLGHEMVQSQTSYYTGFDDSNQNSSWTLVFEGSPGPVSEWQISSGHQVSQPNSLEHLYPVMGQTVVDNYFVSPAFDFTNGGMIDSVSHRFSGFGTPMGVDTVGIYLLVGGNTPSIANSSILLKSFSGSDYINDGIWRKSENIPIPKVNSPSYIAFRYSTTVNWLDVQFDNLYVRSEGLPNSIEERNQATFQLASNPVQNELSFNHQLDGEYAIYSISGLLIESGYINSSTLSVKNLSKGIFVFKTESFSQKFIKL